MLRRFNNAAFDLDRLYVARANKAGDKVASVDLWLDHQQPEPRTSTVTLAARPGHNTYVPWEVLTKIIDRQRFLLLGTEWIFRTDIIRMVRFDGGSVVFTLKPDDWNRCEFTCGAFAEHDLASTNLIFDQLSHGALVEVYKQKVPWNLGYDDRD